VKHRHPLFAGIPTGPDGLHAYFVHSYHLDATKPDQLLAEADSGGQVTAAVGRDNMAGTQFHPEKSQALGLALIANFLRWKP
jgi:imidazole glycerol-phosphate synthase subunit HisH